MDNAGYTTLTRQAGLLRELSQVANNIANMSTTGYRREGTVFSEYVHDTGDKYSSLSMATSKVRNTNLTQGALTQTAAPFDLAIEGEGFFLVETPIGERLTRAGSFSQSESGELVTPDGHRLLDEGRAPVFVPPDASDVSVGSDGTLTANGEAVARIGLWVPEATAGLQRQDGVLFGTRGAIAAVEGGQILQGFLESANVNPITEIARMIEVQRNYELGQSFLDKEDERIRSVLRAVAAR